MREPFKTCSVCGKSWLCRAEFLEDPHVRIAGYQPDFGELSTGLVLFNHVVDHCLTTLAIPVSAFTDLYSGPIFQERLTGTDECPKHCLHWSDISRCPKQCECAYVRELLHRLTNLSKAADQYEVQSA